MEETHLYDITEVCRLLGITSRTLRFYEQKGLITSTTLGVSARRHYTEEQLLHIRNVLALRTLGLSIKAILELQMEKYDLKYAILSKRAEIYAFIDSRVKEINLLNEALCILEEGKYVFEKDLSVNLDIRSEEFEIANICTNAILNNDDELLYTYFSQRLIQYMPNNVYNTVLKDTLAPIGEFVGVEEISVDENFPNKLYSKVRYSKIGLKITFVFHAGVIDGFWLGYYNVNERGIE